MGSPRSGLFGNAARGYGGKRVGGLRERLGGEAGPPPLPPATPLNWVKAEVPGTSHADAMAAAAEAAAPPPTDASWEGGGDDEEMKQSLPELESSPQNGGGRLGIAEPGGGGGGEPEETAAAQAGSRLGDDPPQAASETGAASLLRGLEELERPVRRSFQIPRKSREKKGGASPSLHLPSLLLSSLHLSLESVSSPRPSETRRQRQSPLLRPRRPRASCKWL